MDIFLIILFSIYFLVLVLLIVGWRKALSKSNSESQKKIFISVVVPFRNEGEGIQKTIQSLIEQDYDKHNFEVILVDDHSTDDSRQHAHHMVVGYESFQVSFLTAEGGKKRAIEFGIAQARGEVIALTDADCQLPRNWLATINDSFLKGEVQLSFGLVNMTGHGFWSELQRMEFSSIMGVTLASWGLGNLVMCNGANLAYRKAAFTAVDGFEGNRNIASGDDEFLLRKIIARYGNGAIGFRSGIVTTHSKKSIQDFLRQRLRWAGKWRNNTSMLAAGFAVFILLVQASWLLLLWRSAVASEWWLISITLAKIFLEISWLYEVNRYLENKFHFKSFLALQILYAPYVVFVGLFSWVGKTEWKGRTID